MHLAAAENLANAKIVSVPHLAALTKLVAVKVVSAKIVAAKTAAAVNKHSI